MNDYVRSKNASVVQDAREDDQASRNHQQQMAQSLKMKTGVYSKSQGHQGLDMRYEESPSGSTGSDRRDLNNSRGRSPVQHSAVGDFTDPFGTDVDAITDSNTVASEASYRNNVQEISSGGEDEYEDEDKIEDEHVEGADPDHSRPPETQDAHPRQRATAGFDGRLPTTNLRQFQAANLDQQPTNAGDNGNVDAAGSRNMDQIRPQMAASNLHPISQPARQGGIMHVRKSIQTPFQEPLPHQAAYAAVVHRAPQGQARNQPCADADAGTGLDLDYDPDELRTKSYTDIKDEIFDFEPNIDETDQSYPHANRNIIELLEKSRHDPKSQEAMFESLNIDEWEEAGDWFMAQFTDIMKRFRELRREKRRLALELEGQIEKRYVAVQSKRKGIDDALGEMKRDGGKVLQGTPKKMRVS